MEVVGAELMMSLHRALVEQGCSTNNLFATRLVDPQPE